MWYFIWDCLTPNYFKIGDCIYIHTVLRICHHIKEVCNTHKPHITHQWKGINRIKSSQDKKIYILQFSKYGLEKVWIVTGQFLIFNIQYLLSIKISYLAYISYITFKNCSSPKQLALTVVREWNKDTVKNYKCHSGGKSFIPLSLPTMWEGNKFPVRLSYWGS